MSHFEFTYVCIWLSSETVQALAGALQAVGSMPPGADPVAGTIMSRADAKARVTAMGDTSLDPGNGEVLDAYIALRAQSKRVHPRALKEVLGKQKTGIETSAAITSTFYVAAKSLYDGSPLAASDRAEYGDGRRTPRLRGAGWLFPKPGRPPRSLPASP